MNTNLQTFTWEQVLTALPTPEQRKLLKETLDRLPMYGNWMESDTIDSADIAYVANKLSLDSPYRESTINAMRQMY